MARGVTPSGHTLAAACVTLWALLSGCGDNDGSHRTAPTAAPYEQVDPVGSVKRPERRYYVHNTNGQCSVYWIATDDRSIRRKVRCPRELQPSERLRLSGRVCFRESDAVERRGPVRCPPSILRPERDDRKDAGEFRLPSHKP